MESCATKCEEFDRLDTLGRNITDEIRRLSLLEQNKQNDELTTRLLALKLENNKQKAQYVDYRSGKDATKQHRI
jgi:hypothetical protein